MTQILILLSFIFFTILTIIPSLLVIKNKKINASDFLSANKSLGGFIAGLSGGATGNSGFIMVGTVAMGYNMGIAGFLLGFSFFAGEVLFWNVFARRLYEYCNMNDKNIETVADLLQFSTTDLKFVKIISIFVCLCLCFYSGAQLIASAKILSTYFEINIYITLIIAGILVILYTMRGGMIASVWTDVGQALLTIILVCFLMSYCILSIGGIDTISNEMSKIEGFTDFFHGHDSIVELILFCVGYFILGSLFALTQPQISARVIALKDRASVRIAKYTFLSYDFFTWNGMLIFGILARLMYGDINSDNTAILGYVAINNFDPIIAGFVLSAIFCYHLINY